MRFMKKLMHRARRVGKEIIFSLSAGDPRPQISAPSLPSHQSYQAYHRDLFAPANDDSSPGRGALEVRNPSADDSTTPIAPRAFRLSVTNSGSQSGCERAPSRMRSYQSLSTVVEGVEESDRGRCFQSPPRPRPSTRKRLTRRNAPTANPLYAGRPVRADNVPLAFLLPDDNDKEVADNKANPSTQKRLTRRNAPAPLTFLLTDDNEKAVADNKANAKLHARFHVVDEIQHKGRTFAQRMLNKTKRVGVAPRTPLSPPNPSRCSGSTLSKSQRTFRRHNNDLIQWDILKGQPQEMGELSSSPLLPNARTLLIPIPSIVITPPSPPLTGFPPLPLSIPTIKTTPSSSNNNALLLPASIPTRTKRHKTTPRGTPHGSPSVADLTLKLAEIDTNHFSTIYVQRQVLEKATLIKSIARQLEAAAAELERLDKVFDMSIAGGESAT